MPLIEYEQVGRICDAFERGKIECMREIRNSGLFGLREAKSIVEGVSSVQQLRSILEEFARGTRRHFSNAFIDLTIKLDASRDEAEAAFRKALNELYGQPEEDPKP